MRTLIIPLLVTACTNTHDGSTGTASLTMDGQSPAVSAWAVPATPEDGAYLLGSGGTIAYLPWHILLGSVPVGTDCVTGTGNGSLRHDASSWEASIEIAVPYAQGDDTVAISMLQDGPIAVATLNSGLGPLTSPLAEIQLFTGAEDVLSSGTLTITSFTDAGIEGNFQATGTEMTKNASGTFSASRCDI